MLATYCDVDGHCYPGNATLAKAFRVSDRSIRRMISAAKRDCDIDVVMVGNERHIFLNYPANNPAAQTRFKQKVYH